MSRVAAVLRHDARLQLRYGFYWAGAFVAGFWIAVLSQLPIPAVGVVLPAFVFLNGTVTTFFFVAGLVLYERREGVLQALVATPLRGGEYLLSKVATLTALATAESLAIAALGWEGSFRVVPVVLGSLGIGVIYTLLGFWMVCRYDSVTDFLLPGGLLVTLLQLPVLGSFGVWDHPVFLLWPSTGPLWMLRAGFEPGVLSAGAWVYAILVPAAWIAALAGMARASLRRFAARGEGGR